MFHEPVAWLRSKGLERNFWRFFIAAFFFDLGFAVYFFLFNLYLLDLHFNERSIGLIGGALTLGAVAGTLPAGAVAKRRGLWPVLLLCFLSAPVVGVLRAILIGEKLQIALAFVAGLAMCLWGVCFSPTIARLTTEENRAFAFSLIFSVSVGTSAIGGAIAGYLPRWMSMCGFVWDPWKVKRLILLLSCGCASVGLVALWRLRAALRLVDIEPSHGATRPLRRLDPFLLRFLPAMALWSAVLASFASFSNVYLVQVQHVSMAQVGIVFSVAQVLQLCAGIVAPEIFRIVGLLRGVVVTQIATAMLIGGLAISHRAPTAIVLYLCFSTTQWMSSPGLYSLLMNCTPQSERSMASSMTIFCNSLLQAGATALAGDALVRFGYTRVLVAFMVGGLSAAAMFAFVVAPDAREHKTIDAAGMAA
jgi:MFS family permease